MFRNVFAADEVADIVMRVIGEIEPTGESNVDDVRYTNLMVVYDTLDCLIDEMIDVAKCKDKAEWTMHRAGKEAMEWIKEKHKQFSTLIEEMGECEDNEGARRKMNETCVECADDGNNIEWKDGQLIYKCDSCPWKEVEDESNL